MPSGFIPVQIKTRQVMLEASWIKRFQPDRRLEADAMYAAFPLIDHILRVSNSCYCQSVFGGVSKICGSEIRVESSHGSV